MSPIPILLLACVAVVGQQSTTQPATRPTTRAAEPAEPANAQEGREVAELWIKALLQSRPNADPARMDDLLDARLVNGFLLLELKVIPGRWPVVIPLEDQPGSVIDLAPIRRPRMLPEEDSPESGRFRMVIHHLGEPGEEIYSTNVEVYSGPPVGQINMTMVQAWTGGSQTVTLIQLPAGLEHEAEVRLHIDRQDEQNQDENRYERVEAGSFEHLARSEPELFDAYVRPMLAALSIEDVMGGDTREVAIQMFLAELPVEEDVRAKVEELLPRLDAAIFESREQAQRELEALGRPAVTALMQIAQDRELSLEQTTRAKALAAPFQPLDPDQLRLRRDDPEFLRQVAGFSGSPEDEALAALAAQRLEELGADPTTRPATRPAD